MGIARIAIRPNQGTSVENCQSACFRVVKNINLGEEREDKNIKRPTLVVLSEHFNIIPTLALAT